MTLFLLVGTSVSANVPLLVAPKTPVRTVSSACGRPLLGSFDLPHGANAPASAYTSITVSCAENTAYRIAIDGPDCSLAGPHEARVPFEIRGGPGYAELLYGCGAAVTQLHGVGSQTFLVRIVRGAASDLQSGDYRADLDVRVVPE